MTDRDEEQTQRTLAEWADELARELGVADAPVDIDEILGIAGTAAHSVLRPAAPLTTYLLGYVAGRAGSGSEVALAEAVQTVRRLAAERGSSRRE
ncbi:hypothetical protein IWX81_000628 [Salinibacterium sp. CAN_S4]|uniref:DUF6457 domain-containing protein n=1 Tax=Salinibacterium sp. CAN_S4 TaxID=2787727 RepID=UPI0018F04443